MNKQAKIIIGVLVALVLISIGFVIASLTQGGGEYSPEKTVAFSIAVLTPGDFDVSMGPINPETGDVEVAVRRGEPAVFTIELTAIGGWDAPVELTVHGLPEGTAIAFSENPVVPGGVVVLTVQTVGLASNTMYVCGLTVAETI